MTCCTYKCTNGPNCPVRSTPLHTQTGLVLVDTDQNQLWDTLDAALGKAQWALFWVFVGVALGGAAVLTYLSTQLH